MKKLSVIIKKFSILTFLLYVASLILGSLLPNVTRHYQTGEISSGLVPKEGDNFKMVNIAAVYCLQKGERRKYTSDSSFYNYSKNKGDFYTIKHAYQNSGFNHVETKKSYTKTTLIFLSEMLKKIFQKNYYFCIDKINSRMRDHKPNINNFKNIEKNIETYYEFPPIIENKNSSTKPIFNSIDSDFNVFREELNHYNCITYIKLK